MKLFDSELKVMDVLWENGELTAKSISEILSVHIGWNINTTYTVIKKCIAKGAIERIEPNFTCCPLISRDDVREYEINELAGKLFDGSVGHLFASLLDRQELPSELIENLKKQVEGGADNE